MEDLKGVESRILKDPIIARTFQEARQKGVKLYLVGGAIRDFLLDKTPRDYDFVLEDFCPSFLKQLGAIFQTSYFPMGKGKGERVFRLVKDGKTLDFTLMVGRMEEDLLRRDFTVNAIAYSPTERKFYAPQKALEDLRSRKIELLSPKAILDDPLRILRALRYSATLGFDLSSGTIEEIKKRRELLCEVAPERILMELDDILLSEAPERALRPMAQWGLLVELFPEMAPLCGLQQGDHHRQDAFEHSVEVTIKALEIARRGAPFPFSLAEDDRLVLAYGALFHDLGKPATMEVDDEGRVHFYGHPKVSRELAARIMKRYPFPNRLRERVLKLVENHMRPLTLTRGEPTERALRRLVNHMGDDTRTLLVLGLAELEAKDRGDEEIGPYWRLCERILDLMEREDVIAPPPLLRGRDLLEMGYSPGPRLGEILREVRRRQIEGELKTKEEALKFVAEHYPN